MEYATWCAEWYKGLESNKKVFSLMLAGYRPENIDKLDDILACVKISGLSLNSDIVSLLFSITDEISDDITKQNLKNEIFERLLAEINKTKDGLKFATVGFDRSVFISMLNHYNLDNDIITDQRLENIIKCMEKDSTSTSELNKDLVNALLGIVPNREKDKKKICKRLIEEINAHKLTYSRPADNFEVLTLILEEIKPDDANELNEDLDTVFSCVKNSRANWNSTGLNEVIIKAFFSVAGDNQEYKNIVFERLIKGINDQKITYAERQYQFDAFILMCSYYKTDDVVKIENIITALVKTITNLESKKINTKVVEALFAIGNDNFKYHMSENLLVEMEKSESNLKTDDLDTLALINQHYVPHLSDFAQSKNGMLLLTKVLQKLAITKITSKDFEKLVQIQKKSVFG